MSSGESCAVVPDGVFIASCAGLEADVQDDDEPIHELPQRRVVADLSGPEFVLVLK